MTEVWTSRGLVTYYTLFVANEYAGQGGVGRQFLKYTRAGYLAPVSQVPRVLGRVAPPPSELPVVTRQFCAADSNRQNRQNLAGSLSERQPED
jgi:hypothetical protein